MQVWFLYLPFEADDSHGKDSQPYRYCQRDNNGNGQTYNNRPNHATDVYLCIV